MTEKERQARIAELEASIAEKEKFTFDIPEINPVTAQDLDPGKSDIVLDTVAMAPGIWAGAKGGAKLGAAIAPGHLKPAAMFLGGFLGGTGGGMASHPVTAPLVEPLRPHVDTLVEATEKDIEEEARAEVDHLLATGATRGNHISYFDDATLTRIANGEQPYEGYGPISAEEATEAGNILTQRNRIRALQGGSYDSPMSGVTDDQQRAIEASMQQTSEDYRNRNAFIEPGEIPPAP